MEGSDIINILLVFLAFGATIVGNIMTAKKKKQARTLSSPEEEAISEEEENDFPFHDLPVEKAEEEDFIPKSAESKDRSYVSERKIPEMKPRPWSPLFEEGQRNERIVSSIAEDTQPMETLHKQATQEKKNELIEDLIEDPDELKKAVIYKEILEPKF